MSESCCTPINGGAPAVPFVPPSALCGTPICIDTTTVNATPQTIDIGTLNARGDCITFQVILGGVSDGDGERGFNLFIAGNAARNNTGNGVGRVVFGINEYTDAVAVPWTTVIAWAGGTVGFAGNVLQLQWVGLVATTIQWRGMILRWAANGATLA